MMLPNGLQYTRQWMTRIIGEEMVQTMFEFARKLNNLQLTDQEHALIFPAVICVKGKTTSKTTPLICSFVLLRFTSQMTVYEIRKQFNQFNFAISMRYTIKCY